MQLTSFRKAQRPSLYCPTCRTIRKLPFPPKAEDVADILMVETEVSERDAVDWTATTARSWADVISARLLQNKSQPAAKTDPGEAFAEAWAKKIEQMR